MKFMMLCGIPGSGKSYLGKQLTGPDTVYLSSDKIREELWGSEEDQQNPGEVFRVMNERLRTALAEGRDVVYDATNTNSKRRLGLLRDITHRFPGIETELHIVATTPEQCMLNQESRERKLDMDVIMKYVKMFQMPTVSEYWTHVYVHNPFYREGMLNELRLAQKGVSQQGTWHQETVDKHTAMVYQYAREHGFSEFVQRAAILHDIGKPLARFVDETGAHFYGHGNAGAYMYLCAEAQTGVLSLDIWRMAMMIEHHMDFAQGFNEAKIRSLVGDDMYTELANLHEADENGAVRESELHDMDILKFMNAFDDWEDRIQKPPYCVTVKHDGDLVLLKYQQLNSDMSIKLVQQSRGSIFKKVNGAWQYVCRPFDKFFNYGEENAQDIDWKSARILEKVDGCFSGNTTVLLGDGKPVRIKEIPNMLSAGKVEVLSMNFLTGKIERKQVSGINIKKSDPNTHWVKITFGETNPVEVTCTTNHVFYVYRDGAYLEKEVSVLTQDDIVVIYNNGQVVYSRMTQMEGLHNQGLKYDIEVEDNHNYFANGILVHNSLMKIYHDGREWRLATNGTADAFKAEISDVGLTFGDVFNRALGYDYRQLTAMLDPAYTYMFELTSPDTQLVIQYDDGVWYLSRRNTKTGKEEFDRPDFPGVKLPREYKMARLDDVIAAANKMSKDEEGFVVNDAESHRVKVKSPEYLIASHLANNKMVSNKNLVMYMQNGTLDDFLAYCPQYKDRVDDILARFHSKCEELDADWESVKQYKDLSKREFADIVKQYSSRSFLFSKAHNPELTASEYLLGQHTPSLMRWLDLKPSRDEEYKGNPSIESSNEEEEI